MILLADDVGFRFGIFSENDRIRAYFKGTYFRSVPATVVDLSTGVPTLGLLYICAENVLFCIRISEKQSHLFELEAGDNFQLLDQGNELLINAINQLTYGQGFNKIDTSSPINYLVLNDKYLLVVDILPVDNPVNGQFDFGDATFDVDDDYIAKNTNLVSAIYGTLHGKAFDPSLSLPGTDMQRSAFMRYLPFFLIILFMLAVVLGIIFDAIKSGTH